MPQQRVLLVNHYVARQAKQQESPGFKINPSESIGIMVTIADVTFFKYHILSNFGKIFEKTF